MDSLSRVLKEAAHAAGMVPVSTMQAGIKDAARDAADVAAEEIRAKLRHQRHAAGQSSLFREVADR